MKSMISPCIDICKFTVKNGLCLVSGRKKIKLENVKIVRIWTLIHRTKFC